MPNIPVFRYFAIKNSSLQTPFWTTLAITPNLRYAIAQAFPDDNLPSPSITAQEYVDALNHSKLLAVKDLFVKTVADRDATLESTNILLFRALHTLAIIYAELEQWQNAESTYKKLLAESDKILGPDSKVAAGAVSNLGKVYEQQGKHEEAETILRRAKLWAGNNLEGESPQYLGAVQGLIPVLTKQGKLGETEKMLEEGLTLVRKMSGRFKEEDTVEMEAVAKGLVALKK